MLWRQKPRSRDPLRYDDDHFTRIRYNPNSGNVAPPLALQNPFSVGSLYEGAKQRLRSAYASGVQWGTGVWDGLASDYEGARCIVQAAQIAQNYAPEAIFRETGYEIASLLEGIIPGLLQMLAVVGATTLLGGVIGGIVGALAAGVGAAPGAVIGGEIGFDAGVAILSWMGLAFLVVSIGKGFVELSDALQKGISIAWAARSKQGLDEKNEVNRAAHELARAVGILLRLILMGIVAYLLKKAAVKTTKGAIGTIQKTQTSAAADVSAATVAEVVSKLRASRLSSLADWVDKNWRKLVDDPRLREQPQTVRGGNAPGSGAPAQAPPLRSKQSVLGQTDGGPGKWVAQNRTKGVDYQEQVSGVERGAEYEVNGVKFDGYDPQRGVLIDAKDWPNILQNADPPGSLNVGWPLQDSIVSEANRQLNATSLPVEWQVSDQTAANAVQQLFNSRQIPINVVYTPKN